MSNTPNYVATENIYAAPHVLAYRKGDAVSASAVEALGAIDKVASDRTKAAHEAVKDAAPKSQ